MSFKTLHSFTLTLDQEVDETTTTEENGQKVTRTSKVKKAVPYILVLKDPSRREKIELAMFQSVSYNDAIKKGLLPKLVMQQSISRDSANTPLSEGEDKNVAAMNARLQELANDFIRVNAQSTPETEDQKERKQTMLLEYITLQKRVTDINTAYQSVYAYTAESYQQTKTLTWLTLFLTYIKKGDDKYEPMFGTGADFAAKEDRLSEMEDNNDPLYLKALEKLPTYWMLFLFGRAGKPEDFIKIEEEWAKVVEAERKMKEDQEKAAKEKITAADTVVVVPETPPVDIPAAPVAAPAPDTPPAIGLT